MKNKVEEKAEEYGQMVAEGTGIIDFKHVSTNAYMDGYNEALRWRDPKEELPEIGEKVIVKTSNGKYAITEMYIPKDCNGAILGKKEWRGSYTFKNSIVGWREIIEQ